MAVRPTAGRRNAPAMRARANSARTVRRCRGSPGRRPRSGARSCGTGRSWAPPATAAPPRRAGVSLRARRTAAGRSSATSVRTRGQPGQLREDARPAVRHADHGDLPVRQVLPQRRVVQAPVGAADAARSTAAPRTRRSRAWPSTGWWTACRRRTSARTGPRSRRAGAAAPRTSPTASRSAPRSPTTSTPMPSSTARATQRLRPLCRPRSCSAARGNSASSLQYDQPVGLDPEPASRPPPPRPARTRSRPSRRELGDQPVVGAVDHDQFRAVGEQVELVAVVLPLAAVRVQVLREQRRSPPPPAASRSGRCTGSWTAPARTARPAAGRAAARRCCRRRRSAGRPRRAGG